MPLTPPPCIEFFVDCRTTDTAGGGSGGSNTGGNTSGTTSTSSDGSSSGGNGTSGTSSSSSTGFSFSSSSTSTTSLAERLRSTSERIAEYTIAATNRGTQAVKGFVFSHGPLPFGATFDPSRSSAGCVQVGQEVQCTVDLGVGESKSFQLSYKVNNSVSCAIARALQTVKNISGSSANGVTTAVSCTMKTVTSSTTSSASSLAANTSSSFGTTSNTTGAYLGTSYGQNGVPNTAIENAIGLTTTTGYGKGYKPVPMPRTGAADILFSTRKSDYVLTAVSHSQSASFFTEAIVTLVLVASIGAAVMRRLYLRYV